MFEGPAATDPQAVGARIRAQLLSTRMTQDDLASRLDVTRSTVARYVAGDLNITTAMLGRIAKALGCDPRDLITDTDEAVA